jgi:predicted nucleic acid-binding protein
MVDTSAWVEYLRRTESPEDRSLDQAIREGAEIATPAPVLMELLAGCRDEDAAEKIQRLMARFDIVEVEGLADFEDAARIQRRCRSEGRTVRSILDCLIAAMALREGRALLARDRDYEVIAELTGLTLVRASAPPPPAPGLRYISTCGSPRIPAICDDCSRVTNLLNRPGVPFGSGRRGPFAF